MRVTRSVLTLVSTLYLLGASATWAADDLDVTITVVGEGESPEVAFELIALPENAAQQGVENSQNGSNTANQARENGKAFGQATAEQAKQKGEEAKNNAKGAAENAANQHQENIKDGVSSKVPEAAQDRIPRDVLDAIDKNRKPDLPPGRRGGGNGNDND